MELGLNKKNAIITGIDDGIGSTVAIEMAAEGANIALCSKNREELNKVKNDILKKGGTAEIFTINENDKEDVIKTINTIKEKFGGIDILVNDITNIKSIKPFVEIEEIEWEDTIKTNLYGYFNLIKYSIPFLKESKSPRIINISSLSGKEPGSNMSYYNITRGAVINLTKTLSKELAIHKILVNGVCHGAVFTGGMNKISKKLSDNMGISPDDVVTLFSSNSIPLGRFAFPEEISPIVIFLASEKSSYITGSIIYVDGGAGFSI